MKHVTSWYVLTLVAAIYSGGTLANSVSTSYGVLKQPLNYLDDALTLTPTGVGVAASIDVTPKWTINLGYHGWDDNNADSSTFSANSELTAINAGVSYYYDDHWSFALGYSRSDEQSYLASVNRPHGFNRDDQAESTSLGLSLGYGWMCGAWFYHLSVGMQSAQWDSVSLERSLAPPSQQGQNNRVTTILDDSGDALSMSISASAAKLWSIDDDRGLLGGVMLAWNNTLSGDSSSLSQTVRRGRDQHSGPRGGAQGIAQSSATSGISTIAGDDHYGQLSFYLSYDLSSQWSLDLDLGFDLGTDTNEQVWSMGVGYYW